MKASRTIGMKKPHKFLSLVYPQKDWRPFNMREVGHGENKKKRARLYLSKVGFSTLVIHREFPLEQVCQVCVRLDPSGRIHVVFFVDEPGEQSGQTQQEPKKAVSVDMRIARLVTLSDGRFLENPRPLERSLGRLRTLQRSLSRKRRFSKTGLKGSGNSRGNTSISGILGVTCFQARRPARPEVRPPSSRGLER